MVCSLRELNEIFASIAQLLNFFWKNKKKSSLRSISKAISLSLSLSLSETFIKDNDKSPFPKLISALGEGSEMFYPFKSRVI